jgi:hypothetical protein
MSQTVTDLAARKYWVVTLESLIPPDLLEKTLHHDNDRDYIKIFPRPAFASALSIAAEHGREIIIVTTITQPDPARQRQHMLKSVNRLCFLAPAARQTVERNLCFGDNATIRDKLRAIAPDAVMIAGDRALLDAVRDDGVKSVWLRAADAPAGTDSGHQEVKIADWLMFFMSRALEKQHKNNMKLSGPAPG